MSDNMSFELHLGSPLPNRQIRKGAADPFRILVLGAFGLSSNRMPGTFSSPIHIDIDNFDAVMLRLAPSLNLSLAPLQTALALRFESLEDFHPDALYRHLDLFAELRTRRTRLADPKTFEAAAAEFGLITEGPAVETHASAENDAAMLTRLLGTPQTAQASSHSGLDGFIKSLVDPYITPDNSARQAIYIAAVDQAATVLMRNILHHPEFQVLEASWRALHDLISQTNETVQIHIMVTDKSALSEELLSGPLEASELYQRLITQGIDIPGTPPWSLLLGDFSFGTTGNDVSLLAALARLAAHCGGPFIAAADPMIIGESPSSDPGRQEQWQRLRLSRLAPWLGLALPRVLVRLPYGTATDPIESFAFEELDEDRRHNDYLWGNPAFACAHLLCAGFQEDGWDMQPDSHLTVDDLPAHIYQADGMPEMQACAEVYLSEREGEGLAALGFMILLSLKGRPEARLLRFQSIADPPAALMGAWV